MRSADNLMDDYSGLSEAEQCKFDKKFLELIKFRKNLGKLVKSFTGRAAAPAKATKENSST